MAHSQTLKVPEMVLEEPSAGRRVRVTPEEYKGTDVFYSLYLPKEHTSEGSYPIIIEYTGNKHKATGSSGLVQDASLGYAAAIHTGAIWAVMPFVDGESSMTNWWGVEEETIEFAITNIRRICENYGGNHAQVFICGFSRGAIAVNYIGLYNEEIADVWNGFFSHDHYDGQREWRGNWGAPLVDYQDAAKIRLSRMKGRAALASQNGSTPGKVRAYFDANNLNNFGEITHNEFLVQDIIKDIPNEIVTHSHTDQWMLWESDAKDKVMNWFEEVLQKHPGTYTISGEVISEEKVPLEGILVQSGRTHFTKTDKYGAYKIEGLVSGERMIRIPKFNKHKIIDLASDCYNIDFKIDLTHSNE